MVNVIRYMKDLWQLYPQYCVHYIAYITSIVDD